MPIFQQRQERCPEQDLLPVRYRDFVKGPGIEIRGVGINPLRKVNCCFQNVSILIIQNEVKVNINVFRFLISTTSINFLTNSTIKNLYKFIQKLNKPEWFKDEHV